MTTYAVILNGIVDNIIVAENLLEDGWVDLTEVTPTPKLGWGYSEGSFTQPSSIPTLTFTNTSISVNNTLIDIPLNNKFYLPQGAVVDFTTTITGMPDIPIIKLVAERYSDDVPSGEEFYITGSVSAEVLNATVTFPLSSNYKITESRNNRAIERMFDPSTPPFKLSFQTLDFLA